MNPTAQPRLRVPIVMAAGGTMIALATLLGRGPSRAALVEAFTIVAAIGYHWLGGRDTDGGSLFGSRADERQEDIGLRASAFAGRATIVVALAGFVVQTARGQTTWPFALLCAVAAVSFVGGIALYRRS
jgi:hypothetical protein